MLAIEVCSFLRLACPMQTGDTTVFETPPPTSGARLGSLAANLGGWVTGFFAAVRDLGAFALITLGVMISHRRRALALLRPLVVQQVFRAGLRLVPMFAFLAAALG